MSPFSADEIIFLVLAAGLLPVIAPLSVLDGNIEVTLGLLDSVDAVLTTNLYGLPDRVTEYTGKTLIEDVAHAMETTVDGQPLGTFGLAGVFSLSKHAAAGSGGVLAVDDEADYRDLKRRRDLLLEPGSLRREITSVLTSMARQSALRLDRVRPALAVSRMLGLEEKREGYRIPARRGDLAAALVHAPELAPFDPWVRADLHHYRCRNSAIGRWYQSRRLRALPRERDRRVAGVHLLAELPSAAGGVRRHVDQPLFRVPLLVEDRDAAIATLERHGVATGYLYDPPYDDYLPGLVEPSPSPEPARWWSRHVLPVDPLYAHRALPVVKRLRPAPPPPLPTAPPSMAAHPL